MNRKNMKNRIRGWFPKEPNLPSNRLKINSEERKVVKIQFTKCFWISLALSYLLFLLLIVLPFLLGYIIHNSSETIAQLNFNGNSAAA